MANPHQPRWFFSHCPACGVSSGVQRLDTEEVSYRCPGCKETITSGPPLPPPPDPLAADRKRLAALFDAPPATGHTPAKAAHQLAAAFDGVVFMVDDQPASMPRHPMPCPPDAIRKPLARLAPSLLADAASVAARYRRCFGREPYRDRERHRVRAYTLRELQILGFL